MQAWTASCQSRIVALLCEGKHLRGEMADLEEGEISCSDSEGGGDPSITSPKEPMLEDGEADVLTVNITSPTKSYQATRQPVHTSYSSDSDSDSNDSSDDDSHYRPRRSKAKKTRVHGMDTTTFEQTGANGSSAASGWSSRKRNNVWGEVLQEQTLSQTMVSLGVDRPDYMNTDRNVESYDFMRAKDDDRPNLAALVDLSEDPSDPFVTPNDPFLTVIDPTASTRRGIKRGRKPMKERPLPQTFDKTKARDHIEATPEDSDPKVVSAIVNLLNEPKVDLIARIVQVIGRQKAMELAYLTEDVEAAGGMMICNGYRRRTPGGVYIRLLKSDPDIPKQQVDDIFAEEEKQFKKASKKKYRANRRRRMKDLAAEQNMAVDKGDQSSDSEDDSKSGIIKQDRSEPGSAATMSLDTIKTERMGEENKSEVETMTLHSVKTERMGEENKSEVETMTLDSVKTERMGEENESEVETIMLDFVKTERMGEENKSEVMTLDFVKTERMGEENRSEVETMALDSIKSEGDSRKIDPESGTMT